MVAKDLTFWQDTLKAVAAPPLDTGPGTLFVAYYASAEMGCHLALGSVIPNNTFTSTPNFEPPISTPA
jgi:hypothetical protein